MEINSNWMVAWLIATCTTAGLITTWDKNRARRHDWRVPENTLWLVAVLGGSVVMYLTMLVVRHKTRHRRFMIGLPLLMLAQAGLLLFLCREKYLIFT